MNRPQAKWGSSPVRDRPRANPTFRLPVPNRRVHKSLSQDAISQTIQDQRTRGDYLQYLLNLKNKNELKGSFLDPQCAHLQPGKEHSNLQQQILEIKKAANLQSEQLTRERLSLEQQLQQQRSQSRLQLQECTIALDSQRNQSQRIRSNLNVMESSLRQAQDNLLHLQAHNNQLTLALSSQNKEFTRLKQSLADAEQKALRASAYNRELFLQLRQLKQRLYHQNQLRSKSQSHVSLLQAEFSSKIQQLKGRTDTKEVEKLERLIQQLRPRANNIQRQNKDLKHQLNRVRQQLQETGKRHFQTQEMLAQANLRLNAKSESLKSVTTTKQRLQDSVSACHQNLGQFKRKNQQLIFLINNLQHSLSKKQQQSQKLRISLQQSSQSCSSLQQKLKTIQNVNQRLSYQLNFMRNEVQSHICKQQSNPGQYAYFQQQLLLKEKRIIQLEKQIAQSNQISNQSKNNSFQTQLKHKQLFVSQLQLQVKELLQEQSRLKATLKEQRLSERNEQSSKLSRHSLRLQQETQNLKLQIKSLEHNQQAQIKAKNRLVQTNQQIRKSFLQRQMEFKVQIQKAQQDNKQAKKKLEDQKSQIESLLNFKKQSLSKIQACQNDIKQLRQTQTDLKSELQNANLQLSHVRGKQRTDKQVIQHLQVQLRKANEQLRQLWRWNESNGNSCEISNSLQNRLTAKQAQCQSLKQHLHASKDRLTKQKDQIHKLEQMIERVSSQSTDIQYACKLNIQKMRFQSERVKRDLQELLAQKQLVLGRLKNTETENRKNCEQIDWQLVRIKELQEMLTAYQSQNTYLNKQVQQHVKRAGLLEISLGECRQSVKSLQFENYRISLENQNQSQKIREMLAVRKQKQTVCPAQSNQQLTPYPQQLMLRIQQLEGQLLKQKIKISQTQNLKKQNSQLAAKARKLQDSVRNLTQKLIFYETSLQEQKKRKARPKETNPNKQDQMRQLQKDKLELQINNSTLKHQLDNFKQQLNRLRNSLFVDKQCHNCKRLAQVTVQNESLKDKLNRLSLSFNKLLNKYKALKKGVQLSKRQQSHQLTSLRSQIHKLNSDITDLEKRQSTKLQQIQVLCPHYQQSIASEQCSQCREEWWAEELLEGEDRLNRLRRKICRGCEE